MNAIHDSGLPGPERYLRDDPAAGVFDVHRDVYRDPALFELEMRHVFERHWVFLAHETQLPRPLDYLATWIGRQPVLLHRDDKGTISAFLNVCPHKGAAVCQSESGNRKFHVCPYHGWTFDARGDCVLVKDRAQGAYPAHFEQADTRLPPLARFGNYRGFLFGSLNPDVPPLEEHLAGISVFLDMIVDQSEQGTEVIPGRSYYTYDANWKMQLENLTDAYHAEYVHASALAQFASLSSTDKKAAFTERGDLENPLAMQRDLGGGHSVLDSFTSNRAQGDKLRFTGSTGTLLPEVIDGVAQRIGSHEQALWMARGGPCHIMVFPNLMLLWDAVRIIQPVSLTRTHIYYHPALLKGAPEAVNIARIRAQEGGFGPAGFLAPDDMEMFERSQAGMAAAPDSWLELNRGRHVERIEADDFGQPVRTCQNLDEVAQRGIWRHYKAVMSGAA